MLDGELFNHIRRLLLKKSNGCILLLTIPAKPLNDAQTGGFSYFELTVNFSKSRFRRKYEAELL